MKVLITTVPFSDKNRLPLDLLEQNGIDYLINPLNKKLTEDELVEMAVDFDAIIAGTEPITKKVMDAANKLRIISRVGIGVTDTGKFFEMDRINTKVELTPIRLRLLVNLAEISKAICWVASKENTYVEKYIENSNQISTASKKAYDKYFPVFNDSSGIVATEILQHNNIIDSSICK